MRSFKALLAVVFILGAFSASAQDKFLKVDDGRVSMYYEDKGDGQAMIFVPGWTMTTEFFRRQKSFFSNEYRYISYDPRGQGRSEKTKGGHHYAQHAEDLRDLIDELEVDDVILVGWSSGCLTMYEYLRKYGHDKLDKLVFIDEPPKWIGDPNTEWVYGSFDGYRGSLKDLITNHKEGAGGVVDWMLQEPVEPQVKNWMIKEMAKTPDYVAVSLYIDGLISDYVKEVREIGSLPALFMVRESWHQQVSNWLKTNAPKSQSVAISSHAMFWEKSQEFNAMLSSFLKK